jgi:hypothetical protein
MDDDSQPEHAVPEEIAATSDAAPAVEREAEGAAPPTITFAGVDLIFPAAVDDWDVDALEAFENGRVVSAMRALFGDATWDRVKAAFRKANGRALKVKDLEPLGRKIAEVYGFAEAGE